MRLTLYEASTGKTRLDQDIGKRQAWTGVSVYMVCPLVLSLNE